MNQIRYNYETNCILKRKNGEYIPCLKYSVPVFSSILRNQLISSFLLVFTGHFTSDLILFLVKNVTARN